MASTFDYETVFVKYFDKKGGLTDQYFNSTPLWERFYGKRKKKNFVSRRPIYIGLQVTDNAPSTYGELETFTRERKQITEASYATPANYHNDLVVSWSDVKREGSPEDMVNMLKARTQNLMQSWAKTMTTALIEGAGTDDALLGFENMISEDGTGTVQGVASSATKTWWYNKYVNGSDAVITLPLLHKVTIEGADGQDKPTLLATDKYLASYIMTTLLQPRERYSEGSTKHMSKLPVVYDIPMITDPALETSGATSGNIWALNENHLYFLVHPKDDMKRHGQVKPNNQLAYATDWTLEGQLVLTQRRKQCLGHSFSV